ncbi:MAG: hypothetical protein R2792_12975 [Saprospiraceae bacterium]
MKTNFTLLVLFCLLFVSRSQAQCNYTLLPCPMALDSLCDDSNNDQSLWNSSFFWDSHHALHDLPEAPVNLEFQYLDSCGLAQLRYELFLDLDGDGIQESVVRPDNLLGNGQIQIFNTQGGGVAAPFDNRAVPFDQKYQFALEQTSAGDTITNRLRWNTELSPFAFSDLILPLGQHQIKWILEDGQQQDTCIYSFEVLDCAPPEFNCVNGLSANVLPTGMIYLFANDFIDLVTDNITPYPLLEFGIRISGTGTGFPVGPTGQSQSNILFSCQNMGTHDLEIWAKDKYGNSAFCETTVEIGDAFNYCPSVFAGPITVCFEYGCTGQPMDSIEASLINLELNFSPPLWPGMSNGSMDSSSCFISSLIPLGTDFTATPLRDDQHAEGITSNDILHIALHILNTDPFSSPYQMIAADVNKSNSITVTDIFQLRQLLLGNYTNFPNNTSWRYVNAAVDFPDPSNPFSSQFPEYITVSNFTNLSPQEYVMRSVKIGDVNCTTANGASTADDRKPIALLAPNQMLESGKSFEIPFFIGENHALYALQAGLQFNTDQIEILEVIPGNYPGMDLDAFAIREEEGLRLVWFHTEPVHFEKNRPLFTLRVQAKQSTQVSQLVHLGQSSFWLKPPTNQRTYPVQLAFMNKKTMEFGFYAPYPKSR